MADTHPEMTSGSTEVEADAEEWVVQTQLTLGAVITKPRLLADRLRKPPFRFLFDIALEISRQTGFGIRELFGVTGSDESPLPAKPIVPNTRDEKAAFLDAWIAAVASGLPSHSADLAQVSSSDIVCGLRPEFTNFFLQCAAAAAWPQSEVIASDTAQPQPEEHTRALSPEQEAAIKAAEEASQAAALVAAEEARLRHEAAVAAARQAAQEAPEVVAAMAAAEQAAAAAAAAAAVAEAECQKLQVSSVPVPPAVVIEPELTPEAVEQARTKAAEMDFDTALREWGYLQEEFSKTSTGWKFERPATAGSPPPPPEPPPPGHDESASDEEPENLPEELRERHADKEGSEVRGSIEKLQEQEEDLASKQTLLHAKQRAEKVNEELAKAQDLLKGIEDALDGQTSVIQRRREEETQKRAALEAEIEDKARAEREAEERCEAENAAKKAERKAAKEAEKARLAAEREAREAEERRAAMFPTSKTSQMNGARLVSCVGESEHEDQEYEWDGDNDESVKKEAEAAEEAERAALPMSECFSDAILGPAPIAPVAGALFTFGNSAGEEEQAELLAKLKVELRDSFVSYLCASMPETLMKKYKPDEILRCMQMLLEELRRYLLKHQLEDIKEEEPTSLAEDLRQHFPNDWLPHLQSATPWTLRQKYELSELLDTFQALCQTCFERLTDELGPLNRQPNQHRCCN